MGSLLRRWRCAEREISRWGKGRVVGVLLGYEGRRAGKDWGSCPCLPCWRIEGNGLYNNRVLVRSCESKRWLLSSGNNHTSCGERDVWDSEHHHVLIGWVSFYFVPGRKCKFQHV